MEQDKLKAFLATEPDGTLEAIADDYQTTLLEVVKRLPQRHLVTGDNFDRVWDAITEWGPVTTLVHSADAIFEFSGDLPTGFHRHGYFNLRGRQGMTGHVRAKNCQSIALVERKFMAMDTASVIFFNQAGNGIFKIFLGRDEHRLLRQDQLSAFRSLGARLGENGA